MTHERPRPGQIHIPHWILHAAHLAAVALAILVVVFLALDQQFGWLRHRPGGDAFDLNEQPVFMVLFAVGALVALRWQLVGGALATFTAAGLIVFAGRQLRAVDAVIVLMGFVVPGLLWLVVGLFELRDERFHRAPGEHPRPLLRRRDLLGGLGVMSVTTVGGVRIGQWIFDRIYGPTHPESRVAAVVGSPTRWVWSGAVTQVSATVTTRLTDDDEQVPIELWVSTSPTLTDHRTLSGVSGDEGIVRMELADLSPGTRYHYAFVVDGVVDRGRIGSFVTDPAGPASFGVAVGSCARTGSNGVVWDTIRSLDPHLMIITGDFHYADITRNDRQSFRQIYDHQLSRPAQAALFQRMSVAYVWDDHDWGGADSDAGGRQAALDTYRRYVPHHPLLSPTSPVNQAFSIGRVRFVMTDVRVEREPADDGLPGTMLGPRQKAWFLEELRAAPADHALTVWVNPVPWISAEPDGDDWNGFAEERREIADFIAANDLAPTLCMISGDAHMVALDDGSNSDYSGTGRASFPILHAAALDRPGSRKGGPYSHGAFPGGGQFGHLAVDDDGTRLHATLTGRDWRNRILVSHTWTVPER